MILYFVPKLRKGYFLYNKLCVSNQLPFHCIVNILGLYHVYLFLAVLCLYLFTRLCVVGSALALRAGAGSSTLVVYMLPCRSLHAYVENRPYRELDLRIANSVLRKIRNSLVATDHIGHDVSIQRLCLAHMCKPSNAWTGRGTLMSLIYKWTAIYSISDLLLAYCQRCNSLVMRLALYGLIIAADTVSQCGTSDISANE